MLVTVSSPLVANDLVATSKSPSAVEFWRQPSHDALNSLYFVFQVAEHEVACDQLLKELPTDQSTSLKQIRTAAAAYGFPLRLVHLRPDQLNEVAPAIV